MNQLPAYLQNRQPSTSSMAATLVGNLGSGSPPYISIRGSKFTAVDSTGAEKPVGGYNQQPDQYGVVGLYVDIVLVDNNEHTSKVWFDKGYSDDQDSWGPPTCWSDNGIGPSRQCASPQAKTCQPDATNTFGCFKATWGSAIGFKGGEVKACKDVQKFACIIPGDDVLYQLRIPPNSRGNLGDYVLKFTQPIKDGQGNILIPAGGLDMRDVVTRLYFDPKSLGTLMFKATTYLDDQTVAQRDKALAEKKTDALVGRGDLPVQQLLAAPAQQQATQPAGLLMQGQPVTQTAPPPQVQQPVPFVPTSPATNTPTPTATTEPQRRRRRTRAEIDAAGGQAPAPQQQPVQQMQQPAAQPAGPFAQGPAIVAAIHAQPGPVQNQQPAQNQSPAQPNNFGMQAAQNSTPEIDAALKDIFGDQA